MTREELIDELGSELRMLADGYSLMICRGVHLPATCTKQDIVKAVRKIREEILLRIDDIICFANE